MKSSNILCCSAHELSTPAVTSETHITSQMTTSHTEVRVEDGKVVASPVYETYEFRTARRVPKTGAMIVGLGGNNGTTFTAGVFANRKGLMWETQRGDERANWLGSMAMSATVKLGVRRRNPDSPMSEGGSANQEDVYVPLGKLLPMVDPNELVVGGWDISGMPMPDAMKRARVLPPQLQHQLRESMAEIKPLPGVYCKDFIATNQEIRADNVLGGDKRSQLRQLMKNIDDFKRENQLEKVVVLWSGNTERFSAHKPGVHDTAANLMAAIEKDEFEIAPSLMYAIAAVKSGCCYINGSPQNTFCPGLLEMARQQSVYLAGDDLKTGQTKFKSVMADFLVSTGLRPTAICSYNHLGNNDGLNLSSERQFKSKETTKASVIDDMIASNDLLYDQDGKRPHPDHLIVIKYVPAVGDSKRALDEYTADIFMNGQQTFVVHNTCEDSLLAVPIMLDLVLFTELLDRIEVKEHDSPHFKRMHPLLSLLSIFCKAPQVPKEAPVVNALFPQREALVDFIKAAAGLPPTDYMTLHHRFDLNEGHKENFKF